MEERTSTHILITDYMIAREYCVRPALLQRDGTRAHLTQWGISVRCAIVGRGTCGMASRIGEHVDNVGTIVVQVGPPGTQTCGSARVAIKHETSLRYTGNVPILNL